MTAAQLRALRKKYGWTQKETAQKLGCSQRSICSWESGDNKIPDSIALAVKAVLLGLSKYGD